jgi:hypothetical protein
MVQTGCGDVGVESWPVYCVRRKGVRKDAYAQFLNSSFRHALVHTIPSILELHQSIKQACSEHAYRGGEAAWPAYCFLPGTRTAESLRARTITVNMSIA